MLFMLFRSHLVTQTFGIFCCNDGNLASVVVLCASFLRSGHFSHENLFARFVGDFVTILSKYLCVLVESSTESIFGPRFMCNFVALVCPSLKYTHI